jgi:integrase
MARKPKPWWWEQRGRWAATIAGERRLAPPEIGHGDEHAAWEWHRRELRAAGASTPSVTVDVILDAWIAWDKARVAAGARSRAAHKSARSAMLKACRTVVAGRKFGRHLAADVMPAHADALMAAWAAEDPPVSRGYRAKVLQTLATAFRWAASPSVGRAALIDASPLDGLRLPAVPDPEERFAERGEAAAWLRWLWRRGHRDFALLQRVLIHTGCRPSEITRATWGEIRWDAMADRAGNGMAVLTLKAWKADRTGRVRRVYLPPRVVRPLLRRRGRPADLLFTSPRGHPWESAGLSNYVTRYRRQAIKDKVPIRDTGPDRLTNYRWRHTAAGTLVMSGVDVATVAELLGTSVKVLLRTYVHLLSGHVAAAASRLANRK